MDEVQGLVSQFPECSPCPHVQILILFYDSDLYLKTKPSEGKVL